MKLNQFAGSAKSDPTLRSLVVNNIFAAAPLIPYVEFSQISGNAANMRKGTNIANTGQTRALDETYAEKKYSPDFTSIALKIMGEQVKTDIAHERRNEDIAGERARQLESFGKNYGLFLQDQLINGDGTGKNISGIRTLIPETRVAKLGVNGTTIPTGISDAAKKAQNQFLIEMNKLVRKVKGGPSVLLMNYDLIALLYSIGREYISKSTVENAVGDKYELATFNGIPIVDAGFKNDGTGLVMPNTETVGTSNDCTSVIAVKFGDQENLTGITSTGIDVFDKGLQGVHYVTMVDFDLNLGLLDDLAVAQLSGIKLEV